MTLVQVDQGKHQESSKTGIESYSAGITAENGSEIETTDM